MRATFMRGKQLVVDDIPDPGAGPRAAASMDLSRGVVMGHELCAEIIVEPWR